MGIATIKTLEDCVGKRRAGSANMHRLFIPPPIPNNIKRVTYPSTVMVVESVFAIKNL